MSAEKVAETGLDVEQANRILELLADSLEGGNEFVLKQAPLLAQEIVTFGRIYYTTMCALCVAVLFIVIPLLVCLTIKLIKWGDIADSGDDGAYFASAFMCGITAFVVGLISIIHLCHSISPCIMAWFAPRYYILETLT